MDRESFADDVPIADAVEQMREARAPEVEVTVSGSGEPPLEAEATDWHEQRETVEPDPDADEFGR